MASFTIFLLWCSSFQFLCFFGHFRGNLRDHREGELDAFYVNCVFGIFDHFLISSLVILHLGCLQDLQRNTMKISDWIYAPETQGRSGLEIKICAGSCVMGSRT